MVDILLVGDATTAENLRERLPDGCEVTAARTGSEALALLELGVKDIVILSTILPDTGSLELLRSLKALHPLVEIIMLAKYPSVDMAVTCIKSGAADYLATLPKYSDLSKIIAKVRRKKSPGKNSERHTPAELDEIVGESEGMRDVKRLVSLFAPSDAPILILGETGTGKELVAKAVHKFSPRASGPFVVVNSSAVPEGILESELFGYRKGAFTGAQLNKPGLLEIAHKGTFFADEIGDMDPSIQAKLLRAVETGTFRKLGDTEETKVDVRFVFATNKDLEGEVKRKAFRADLFYRLGALVIKVPPLCQRTTDIPLLVKHFLSGFAEDGKAKGISAEALGLLANYAWPGNVRELSNALRRAVILSREEAEIDVDKLPLDVLKRKPSERIGETERTEEENILVEEPTSQYMEQSTFLEEARRRHIEEVLKNTDGNKAQTARLLGISRSRIYRSLGVEGKGRDL